MNEFDNISLSSIRNEVIDYASIIYKKYGNKNDITLEYNRYLYEYIIACINNINSEYTTDRINIPDEIIEDFSELLNIELLFNNEIMALLNSSTDLVSSKRFLYKIQAYANLKPKINIIYDPEIIVNLERYIESETVYTTSKYNSKLYHTCIKSHLHDCLSSKNCDDMLRIYTCCKKGNELYNKILDILGKVAARLKEPSSDSGGSGSSPNAKANGDDLEDDAKFLKI
jgi:hypothetical protein